MREQIIRNVEKKIRNVVDRKKSVITFRVEEPEIEEREKRTEKNLKDLRDFATMVSGELVSDKDNIEGRERLGNITRKRLGLLK